MTCGTAIAQRSADSIVHRQIRRDAEQYVAEQSKRYATPYELAELSVHFVDINNDSLKDAVVVLMFAFRGTFEKDLWIYLRTKRKFVRTAMRYLGKNGWDPSYTGFVGGLLTFNVAVHLDGDHPCCSTGKGFAKYMYKDTTVELVAKGMIDSTQSKLDSSRMAK